MPQIQTMQGAAPGFGDSDSVTIDFHKMGWGHDPALFTLECSRPGTGPYSVMASLNGIGLNGYRLLIAYAMDLAPRLKEKLEALEFCKVLNFDTPGPQVF